MDLHCLYSSFACLIKVAFPQPQERYSTSASIIDRILLFQNYSGSLIYPVAKIYCILQGQKGNWTKFFLLSSNPTLISHCTPWHTQQ